MAKRKANFIYSDPLESTSKKKNSLDSDEEDDDTQKYEILHEDDIEGQEANTIDTDGEIQITPFNMKDELEEGHFDKDGNYFFNKEEKIRDGWLDNIDWIKIKATEKKNSESADQIEDDDIPSPLDKQVVYQEMLELMKAGETVSKSLKRLGGSLTKNSASSRWSKKKNVIQEENPELKENKEKFLKLTELANKLVLDGDLEIYQETFERLQYQLKSLNKTIIKEEEMLDMFAENYDEKVESKNSIEKSDLENENSQSTSEETSSDEVYWEFKWENTESAKIYGPHSSKEMLRWVEEGYFPTGVWVRRTSQKEAPFYNSQRIDFDLYT